MPEGSIILQCYFTVSLFTFQTKNHLVVSSSVVSGFNNDKAKAEMNMFGAVMMSQT